MSHIGVDLFPFGSTWQTLDAADSFRSVAPGVSVGGTDVRKTDASPEEIAEKCFRVGLALLEMEKLAEAYAVFCRGIELSPGHAMLQLSLGQAFDAGLGIEKDDSKAVEWYSKAAEQGLMAAMYFLARKYEYGHGIPRDSERAIRWYRTAAEGGLPEAQYELGEHYLTCEDEPVDENWREAAFWFRKAAEQGHSNAQLRLAGMNEDGLGIPQDLHAAVYWYRRAAEQGNELALAALDQFETE